LEVTNDLGTDETSSANDSDFHDDPSFRVDLD
jgi:hypothetical protein